MTKTQAKAKALRIRKAIFSLTNEKERRRYLKRYYGNILIKSLSGQKVGKITDYPRKRYFAVSLKYGYGKYNYAPCAIIFYYD